MFQAAAGVGGEISGVPVGVAAVGGGGVSGVAEEGARTGRAAFGAEEGEGLEQGVFGGGEEERFGDGQGGWRGGIFFAGLGAGGEGAAVLIGLSAGEAGEGLSQEEAAIGGGPWASIWKPNQKVSAPKSGMYTRRQKARGGFGWTAIVAISIGDEMGVGDFGGGKEGGIEFVVVGDILAVEVCAVILGGENADAFGRNRERFGDLGANAEAGGGEQEHEIGDGEDGGGVSAARDEAADVDIIGEAVRRFPCAPEGGAAKADFERMRITHLPASLGGGGLFGGGGEFEGDGVDAVAVDGFFDAVDFVGFAGEDVSEVGAATGAGDLGAVHAEGVVVCEFDFVAGFGGVEGGPAAACVELGFGGEEFLSAGGAGVGSAFVEVVVFSGRRARSGAFFAEDGVLFGGEDFFPFFVGVGDGHGGIPSPWWGMRKGRWFPARRGRRFWTRSRQGSASGRQPRVRVGSSYRHYSPVVGRRKFFAGWCISSAGMCD